MSVLGFCGSFSNSCRIGCFGVIFGKIVIWVFIVVRLFIAFGFAFCLFCFVYRWLVGFFFRLFRKVIVLLSVCWSLIMVWS